MINIAKTLEDIDKKSPHFELEMKIKNDIVKKFSDIIIFIDKYNRQYRRQIQILLVLLNQEHHYCQHFPTTS